MVQVQETKLPGVGVRQEFTTRNARALGVLTHRDGHRELLVGEQGDPDAVTCVVLQDDESDALAALLGAPTLSHSLDELPKVVEGVAVEHLPLPAGSAWQDRTIGATQARTRTGASVVALIGQSGIRPGPGPEEVIEDGDTVVAVGTPEALLRLAELLAVTEPPDDASAPAAARHG